MILAIICLRDTIKDACGIAALPAGAIWWSLLSIRRNFPIVMPALASIAIAEPSIQPKFAFSRLTRYRKQFFHHLLRNLWRYLHKQPDAEMKGFRLRLLCVPLRLRGAEEIGIVLLSLRARGGRLDDDSLISLHGARAEVDQEAFVTLRRFCRRLFGNPERLMRVNSKTSELSKCPEENARVADFLVLRFAYFCLARKFSFLLSIHLHSVAVLLSLRLSQQAA